MILDVRVNIELALFRGLLLGRGPPHLYSLCFYPLVIPKTWRYSIDSNS